MNTCFVPDNEGLCAGGMKETNMEKTTLNRFCQFYK